MRKNEPREHGTISTYNNYACRCDPCRAARTAYAAKYARKKREREQGRDA